MSLLKVFDQNRATPSENNSNHEQDMVKGTLAGSARKPGNAIKTFMVIDQEAKVTGQIDTAGDVVIEGDFEGEIIARNLALHSSGRIQGKVNVVTAQIDGELSHEIVCSGLLTIQSNGKVRGRMVYGELIVEQGGKCVGEILEHQLNVKADSVK
jgi:cytoskeletal protein CcmA (bactofilin family)